MYFNWLECRKNPFGSRLHVKHAQGSWKRPQKQPITSSKAAVWIPLTPTELQWTQFDRQEEVINNLLRKKFFIHLKARNAKGEKKKSLQTQPFLWKAWLIAPGSTLHKHWLCIALQEGAWCIIWFAWEVHLSNFPFEWSPEIYRSVTSLHISHMLQ